ncbi:UDP-N-acetylmuramoyl-L-alanine--D-glutamate ligase [Nordella sp. HKS 07]|uniref:UDP-N-acetylmuramoyl-L-alanine--D-glutamate ligase n=1 Tax=Nordella sp. HKS 07 TaxID=2712222 RepID=UPI0013E10EA6|nr:UDP-N-acetylmuramoyl-L-alanine--D-glutamate ligase [Nordella sp. HKS 07]QIG51957.1 UDP-N-acetylmuramoyl-L-alanine--D-glutamate ligase [Nordella sp. HKS 07]
MFPAKTFAGRKVGVFGLARSGTACAEALRLGGAEVHAWDDQAQSVEKAKLDGLPVGDLKAIDFTTLDSLVLSPGVPLTHPKPHWTVEKAKAAGIEIIGDTEVFQRELAGTGAKLVAITGTNGKSTTTALTGHLFQSAGRDVDVGGNIGKAVFLLRQPVRDRVYVLELSSFQIDLMPSLRPDAGILINITPDHLDRHGTIENYVEVKARMFAHQGAGDTAIIGVDESWGADIVKTISAGAHIVPVSVERALAEGLSAPDGILSERRDGKETATLDLRQLPALKGRHNWQNAAMAFAAGRALGLSLDEIRKGLMSFSGLAHRMQEIGRLDDIAFINDSKATNADAAAKALAAFDDIYWIAGGIAKAGGIAPLSQFFPKIKRAYLIGEAADEFARTIGDKAPFIKTGTLDKAVEAAARDAARDGNEGAVVLLSPACASFDHYPNFEVRGDAFSKAVAALPGIRMTAKGNGHADKPQ